MTTDLTIVIPTKNEGANIFKIYRTIMEESYLNNIPCIVMYVDDYSDNYDALTRQNYNKVAKYENVYILNNNGAKGQYNATVKGIKKAFTNYIAVVDCDMQDPIKVLFEMYKKLKRNPSAKACLGTRKSRKDTFLKILTANMYYKTISVILHKKIYKTSSFYVIKKEVSALIDSKYPTGSLQTRTVCITYPYHRKYRYIGKTKYNIFKMLNLGRKGVNWAIKERKYNK